MSVHGEAAVVLVRELFVVLDRRLPARLNELSDRPEGSLAYPTEPDKDLVGTIRSESGDVDIVVERVGQKNAGSLWLFSRQTLGVIPELYAEVTRGSRQFAIIKFLLDTRIAHIALINWVVLFVCLPLLHFVARRLNPFLSRLGGHLLRRARKNPGLPDPDLLSMPVRLLLLAFIIRWALSAVTFPLVARQIWSSLAAIAFIVGCVWFIIRLNNVFEERIRLRLDRRNLTGGVSVLRFVRSAVDILIIFVGLLIVLHYFGIDATAAVAGLGVGGIAVALAAQKTLENVIAGISLVSDKAIRVGDVLKVSNTVGTVSSIGLRSTRIRTMGRTVVNVPNGQIASASLENLSARDKFWFRHILGLSYNTNVTQLRSIVDGLTNLLIERRGVEESSVRVRFLRFAASSLEVEMFAYFSARDWSDFLKIQEELLFEVMNLVQEAGTRIAFPSQTIYLTTHPDEASDTDMPFQRFTNQARTTLAGPKRSSAEPLSG